MTGAVRVVLIDTADGRPEERAQRVGPVIDALLRLGFEVAAPAAAYPDTLPIDAIPAVRAGMAALRAADYVVVLPGAEDSFEVSYAVVWDKAIVTLDQLGVTTAA